MKRRSPCLLIDGLDARGEAAAVEREYRFFPSLRAGRRETLAHRLVIFGATASHNGAQPDGVPEPRIPTDHESFLPPDVLPPHGAVQPAGRDHDPAGDLVRGRHAQAVQGGRDALRSTTTSGPSSSNESNPSVYLAGAASAATSDRAPRDEGVPGRGRATRPARRVPRQAPSEGWGTHRPAEEAARGRVRRGPEGRRRSTPSTSSRVLPGGTGARVSSCTARPRKSRSERSRP